MDELVERWGRWLQNTGYDGGINSPAMLVLQRMKDDANRIERQEAEIRSLREQVAKERAGIVDWLRAASERADNLSQKNAFEYAAGMIEAQQDKEPT